MFVNRQPFTIGVPVATKGRASFAAEDSVSGGGFQGGITKFNKLKIGRGYQNREGETTNADILTLQLTHTPKATGEPVTKFMSWGAKTSEHFKPSKDGASLVPTTPDARVINTSNAMLFLTSLEQAGYPKHLLKSGDLRVLQGIVAECREEPIDRPGLQLQDTDQPKTVFKVKKIVSLPKVKAQEAEEAPPETTDSEDEDDDTDDDDLDEEDDSDDSFESTRLLARPADEEDSDDDTEDDHPEDDDGEEDDEDEESDPDTEDEDAAEPQANHRVSAAPGGLAKTLTVLLQKEGGKIKRAKLASVALKHLRTLPIAERNATVTRLANEQFLLKQQGWTYNAEKGVLSLV